MRKYLFFVVAFIACRTGKVIYAPIPTKDPTEISVIDTIRTRIVLKDTVWSHVIVQDSVKSSISITDFGAHSGITFDNADALQLAVDYAIKNRIPLTVPLGDFFTSRSILCQNNGQFFTLHLKGIFSNKSSSNEYLSKIIYTGKSGYALGIQLGRSILIENLTILGQYTLPNSLSLLNVVTYKFSDWIQPGITDTRYNPYAGISIDPIATTIGGGGTSDVTIRNCSIRQFMVGAALSPNGWTANAEMINFIDDDIEACRVAFAICQDQSKEIHIDRFKCWSSTHTILDGITYGAGTGGGSVMISGMNIAGAVNQLFNLITDRFPLSAKDIYSESLFRIGKVGRGAGTNFINASIDFITGPGMPAPDYLLMGDANFYGGCIRYYDGNVKHRMKFVNTRSMFRDMTLSSPAIIFGLIGGLPTIYAVPRFDNVNYYYSWGVDTFMTVNISSAVIDRVNWTATLTAANPSMFQVGDYVLGAAAGGGSSVYYDTAVNNIADPAKQIGRVTQISGNTISLTDVGLDVYTGDQYDAVYIDRLKN